jgi:hypothetical protein
LCSFNKALVCTTIQPVGETNVPLQNKTRSIWTSTGADGTCGSAYLETNLRELEQRLLLHEAQHLLLVLVQRLEQLAVVVVHRVFYSRQAEHAFG